MGNETKTTKKRHPFFTLLIILSVLLILAFGTLFVYPTPIVRYVFSRVEAESGISLTCDRAYFYLNEGSFLAIDGLTATRQNHHAGNFELRVESVRMPAMVPGDFYEPVLLISGLRGTYERVGDEETTEGEPIVKVLMLTDAEIEFIDKTLEKPFHTTIKIKEFTIAKADFALLFEPYVCMESAGQIDSVTFGIDLTDGKQRLDMEAVPLGLFAPYAPVLNDIFAAGNMNIRIDDLSEETQKKLRIAVTLLPDCKIKPANEIIAPVIQEALQQLDHSAVPVLRDTKEKIDRLKTTATSLRGKVDKAAPIVGAVLAIAAPNAREEYEKIKNEYDRIANAYDEWNAKFEQLSQDIDKMKVGIVNDTFQYFVESGIPIEAELQQVDGEWQCDWYATAIQLIEKHYRTIVAIQFQQRILEIQESVDRLLAL